MLLMIDNYDSFTYNVVQYLAELGADVKVVRNDEIDLEDVYTETESYLISPGPCTPNEAGISDGGDRAFPGRDPDIGGLLGASKYWSGLRGSCCARASGDAW